MRAALSRTVSPVVAKLFWIVALFAGMAVMLPSQMSVVDDFSRRWTDAIWSAARRLNRPEFLDQSTPIEDDHDEFLEEGVESVDIIDLDYPNAWHEATDDLNHVSAKSMQAVGDVVLAGGRFTNPGACSSKNSHSPRR